MADLPREFPVPPGLEDRVVASVRQTSRPPRRAWLAVAAALLIAASGASGYALGRKGAGPAPSATGDKYLLLLYGADSKPGEEEARFIEYSKWGGQLASRGQLEAAERLVPVASVVGPRVGAVSSAEEALGFFLIRASSLQEAEAIAAECPHAKHGGTVVVRKAG
jgi:hypothetical protein